MIHFRVYAHLVRLKLKSLRLTQIKLAGFKSFVDPTAIATPGQLVGIVGPNGCGKSNVIDAVRWVLGEPKASALREGNSESPVSSLTAGSSLSPRTACTMDHWPLMGST